MSTPDDNKLLGLVDDGLKAAFLSKMYAGDDARKKEEQLKQMEERQQKYSQKPVDQSDLNRIRAIVSGKSRVLKAYVDSHAPGK